MNGRNGALLGLAGYLATLGLWLSYAAYGFNPWDECALAYGGVRVLQGQVVWIDFFGYAPGRYLLAALIDTLFGINLLVLRVGFLAITAVMPILAYSIGRRLMPGRWAVVPALMIALAPSTYYFRSYPMVALLGAWSLCRLVEAPTIARQLAHGLVLSFSCLMEAAAGGFIVLLTPVTLWLTTSPWVEGWRGKATALARIAVAAVAGATPALLVYAWNGKLLDVLSLHAYHYIVKGTSFWIEYPRPWDSLMEGDWQQALADSLFWTLGGSLAATVVFAAAAILRRRRHFAPEASSHAAEEQLLLLLLLGMLNYLLAIYRAGFFNVLRSAPLAWILAIFLTSRLWSRNRVAGALPLLYALAFAILLVSDPQYRNNATGGPPGAALNAGLIPLADERGGILVEPRHERLIRIGTRWIERTTREHDPIFALPLNPLFYYFGRRNNPTSQDWLLPGTWRDEAEMAETAAELERRPPKVVIYGDVPIDGQGARRFKVFAAPLHDYLMRRYAWTEHLEYPMGASLDVPFYLFRRLRPAMQWPRLIEACESMKPTKVTGPVEMSAGVIAGQRVWSWRIGPGGVAEVQVEGSEPVWLTFRPVSSGAPDAWQRPSLRVSVAAHSPGNAGTAPNTIVTPQLVRRIGPDLSDDHILPPMNALRLVPTGGDSPLRVQLGVPATRLEYLDADWRLIQPCLIREQDLFYARDDDVREADRPSSSAQ